MKITILSPHIDDAAFCLALTISKCVECKMEITIINCFTVTDWAIRFVAKNKNEISLMRKKEDELFYKSYQFPIKIVNLDLLDAPLRNGFIFQERAFAEKEWQVVKELKKHLNDYEDGILFCPLAIGDHIDHAICRQAVIQLYRKIKVIFFEDLPYAFRITEAEIFAHVHNLQKHLKVKLNHYINSSEQVNCDKEQLVKIYDTQINEEICAEIIAHMKAVCGERFWGEAKVLHELNSYSSGFVKQRVIL
jgi:LmbE family N-acetylglucosaminyl deacetylase